MSVYVIHPPPSCGLFNKRISLLFGLFFFFTSEFVSQVHSACIIHDSTDQIELTGWSSVIESPGLASGQYPNGQDCSWSISVSPGSKVSLTFDLFSLEEGVDQYKSPNVEMTCFDYVTVENSDTNIKQLCGVLGNPLTVTSLGNNLIVNFHSDNNGQELGFRARYSGICRGEITEDTIITSPGFPNPPPTGVTCSWTVKQSGRMTSVIRALGITTVKDPNVQDFSAFPPRCGKSPFKTLSNSNDETDLCLLDSVDAHLGTFVLKYSVSDGVEPWTGQLVATFTAERSCTSICINSQNCQDFPPQVNGELNYACECFPGFTGQNCEVEISVVDPCSVHSCERGSCENLPELGRRKCTCDEGYTGDSCETALVNACSNVNCQHNGVCVILQESDYVCDCAVDAGYTGKLCNIPVGSGYCKQELDSVPGSGILWHDSPVGQPNFEPCPGETQGNASRFCLVDKYSMTGGLWTRPDLSLCISPEVFQLSLDAKQLLDSPHPTAKTPASILNITSRLATITDAVVISRADGQQLLYPGDLLVSADVIKTISIATERTQFARAEETVDLTQKYTQVVDNIVDPKSDYLWRNARSVNGKTKINQNERTSAIKIPPYLGPQQTSYSTRSYHRNKFSKPLTSTDTYNYGLFPRTINEWNNLPDNTLKCFTPESSRHHLLSTKLFVIDLVESQVTNVVESTQQFMSSLFLNSPAMLYGTAKTRANYKDMFTKVDEKNRGGFYQLTSKNVEIYVSQYNGKGTVPQLQFEGNTSSVGFSTSILDQWTQKTERPATIYVARFKSIAALLSFKDDRQISYLAADNTSMVNSDVISAAVLEVPEDYYSHIRRPIVLTFSLQDQRLSKNLTKKCVFMNMTAISFKDRWSSKGCMVKSSNDSHVVCYCYHLTNFAVLMDIYENQDVLDPGQDVVLTYISYIGSVLSIIGCLVTIVTFQYLGLRNDRVRIHQQLGASIIFVQILFICVGVTGKDHGTPMWGCKTLSILLHYCLTAMFCWMLVEGIHLYVVLVQIFELGSHLKKYIAIGWGVPLVVVGVCVGVFYDRYGTGNLCWLDHELLLVCFTPTVGLVILINTVILAVVIKIMINSNNLTTKINQQEHNNIKTSLKATGVLLPLLGLTWVLGFLAFDTGGRHVLTYIFTYLFTLSNSFQGVLFFIFHCLLNVDVHLAYERRFRMKKRFSYVETMSSRTRKLSEPDILSPHRLLNNSKSTNTTRSTLTNLSLGDNRSSERDKDPIIVDEIDRLPRLSMPWASFNPAIIPEPDYPRGYINNIDINDNIDDNIFQTGSRASSFKSPSITSSLKRNNNTDSELGSGFIHMPRAQRNSVRFT